MTDRLYGGFWRRLVAYAIDKIILYFISLFLFLTALLSLGLSGGVSLHASPRPAISRAGWASTSSFTPPQRSLPT